MSVIDLSGNDLTGSIPRELGDLTRLEVLVLSLNGISGEIPDFLANMTTLRRFAANQNQFQGSIPSGITSHLGVLDLSYNNLTGAIPVDLLSGPNLQSLDLTHNNLQGGIPASSSSKLIKLRLGSNALNGTIPAESWGSLGELMYLELDNNALSGEIPPALGTFRNLTLLNLAHNRLTGVLPPVLGSLTNLVVLSLEFNDIVGETPTQISQLVMLSKLNLSSNGLNGTIPDSMSYLRSLSNLDLQGNSLSGSIPESIGDLSSLIELQLGWNQLSGVIPDMPPKLQKALNLSHNLFMGRIPIMLWKLKSLEVLDLSNNKFSGEIPQFLTDLGSLTHLLLADNDLTGVIPVFNGYVTLDVTGNGVTIPPRGNTNLDVSGENDPPQRSRESLSIDSDFVVAFTSGVPVGLLITLAVFILRKYYRIQCNLLTPSSIYRSSIDFTKAMEAVADPSNIILKTSYSTYYKAVMPSGTTYFVKKISRKSNMVFLFQDLEKLSNSNVMIPVAYVLTMHSAYFLYDSAAKCTLSYLLHRRTGDPLDWASRYSIAVGVCKGLAYLHECDSGPIILLDLSSESILLKSLTEPQIGDIEPCKLARPQKCRGSSISAVAVSAGYVPPEYDETMRATATGNVYSFGIVLLELVTGKAAVSEGTELAEWVLTNSQHQHKWDHILDSTISRTSVAVRSQMVLVLEVALACVSISPETRPNMLRALQMLNAPRRQHERLELSTEPCVPAPALQQHQFYDKFEMDKRVEIWKIKKLTKSLECVRGNGANLISLFMPPGDQISCVTKLLDDEFGIASDIESGANRQYVLGAIASAQQQVKLYNRIPPNGLVLYTGTIVTDDGKEKKITLDFEPFGPINAKLYLCDNKFHTEPLNELLESEDKYGFIVMDANETLFGTLSGNTREVIHKFTVDLPKKHERGGQSRLRTEKHHKYVKKTAELAIQFYINPLTSQPNVSGLILAGSADFKTELSQSDMFDPRLHAKILNVVDVSYGGKNSFNQAIEQSAEILSNVKFIQEKRLLSKYFEEISQDTGKYVFGVEDTVKVLEMGVVETLIVWENLDMMRYTLKNIVTGEIVIKHLNREQENDHNHFQDPATNVKLEVQEKLILLEWFVNEYKRFGCNLEFVSYKSQEGFRFCRDFGGIGGILRHQLDG